MMEYKATLKLLLVLAVVSAVIGQDWTTFQKKHVLNPSVDSGYAGWNRSQWNSWLSGRITDYGTKSVNSVLVQAPATILTKFAFSNPAHNAGPDFRWSSTKIPTYVLQLVSSSKTYDVYRCPDLFVLTRLDTSARPMHYHGYATTQLSTGSLPLNLSHCTKVN